MSIIQNIILVVTAVTLFFGSMNIIFSQPFDPIRLLLFWIIVIVPTKLLYSMAAEQSQEEEKKKAGMAGTIYPEGAQFPPPPAGSGTEPPIGAEISPTLFAAKTKFPYDPYPDEFVIQRKSITFIRKDFIFFGKVITVPIERVENTIVYDNPLFSVLQLNFKKEKAERPKETVVKVKVETPCEQKGGAVEGTAPQGDEQSYNFPFSKNEALEAKEIIDGLILERDKVIEAPPFLTPNQLKEFLRQAARSRDIEAEIIK